MGLHCSNGSGRDFVLNGFNLHAHSAIDHQRRDRAVRQVAFSKYRRDFDVSFAVQGASTELNDRQVSVRCGRIPDADLRVDLVQGLANSAQDVAMLIPNRVVDVPIIFDDFRDPEIIEFTARKICKDLEIPRP